MKKTNYVLNSIKKLTERQIDDAINQKCIFLCFQPKLPNSINNKKQMIKDIKCVKK